MAPMPEPEGVADEAVESLEIELLESTRCGVLRYRFGDDFGAASKGVSDRSGTFGDMFINEFLDEPENMSSLLGLRWAFVGLAEDMSDEIVEVEPVLR